VDLPVNLVTNHISSSICPGAQGDIRVFYNVLVSFLKGSRSSTLYGFGNAVGGVLIGGVSEDFRPSSQKGQPLYGGAAGARKKAYLMVSIVKLGQLQKACSTEFWAWIEVIELDGTV
jgi:hypothetical protein